MCLAVSMTADNSYLKMRLASEMTSLSVLVPSYFLKSTTMFPF